MVFGSDENEPGWMPGPVSRTTIFIMVAGALLCGSAPKTKPAQLRSKMPLRKPIKHQWDRTRDRMVSGTSKCYPTSDFQREHGSGAALAGEAFRNLPGGERHIARTARERIICFTRPFRLWEDDYLAPYSRV